MTRQPPARSVLLVDDDDMLRRSLKRLFRRDGWTVTEAADGIAAMEALDDGEPDLVLTDMRMPRMGGRDLLEAMRAARMRLPTIVLSGYHDFEVEELLELGAGAVLNKPVEPTRLREVVAEVLGEG